MDENLTNKIDEISGLWDANHEDCQNCHTPETFLSLKLTEAGYRLDPYPNGKSKPELIDIIAQKDVSLSRARNFLRAEHERRVKETYAITMDRHNELKPDCEVCRFLVDTSVVKS